MAGSLRALTPAELRRATIVADSAVAERWRRALARSDVVEHPLVSLLDDWSHFSGADYRGLLRDILSAQSRIDAEWADQRPEEARAAAEFYDRTDTLTPLLLWWHGRDLNPARCAVGASSVLAAIGGHRVLDFGCGIGSSAVLLAHEGSEVAIADVATEPLRFAEWRLSSRGHSPRVLNLLDESIEALGEGACDAVVAFDVFEHLPDPTASMVSLDRVLARRGVICLNQAYVPADDEPQHFPRRGEVLAWLHGRGYRLAHVPSVCWVAQKEPLARPAQLRQGASLRARIASSYVPERLPPPLREPIGFRIIRHALR